ncbi:MAG: hypothetical protein AAF919_08645 [Pseudomonadota bacterium]
MAHPQDIEDVLSSIRRLVATEGPPLKPRATDPVTGQRDTSLPALFLDPANRVTDPEDPFQMIRSLAQEERDGRDAETFMEDMDPDIAAITGDMPSDAFSEWDMDDDPELTLTPDFRGPITKAAPDEDRGSVADRIIAQLRAAQGDRRDPDADRDFEGTVAPAASTTEADAPQGADVVSLSTSANWPQAPGPTDELEQASVENAAADGAELPDEDVPTPLDQPEIASLGADYDALSADEADAPDNILVDVPENVPDAPSDAVATSERSADDPDDLPVQVDNLADQLADGTAHALPGALTESLLADDAVRDLIAQIVREELAGDLGERITRNVRKLVRRELRSMMAAGEFD